MRTLIGVAASLLALAACSSTDGGGGATGGTIIVDLPSGPDDVLPPFANDDASRLVTDNVFDHLADISTDMNFIGDKTFTPHLAKSWTWAPDSLSIVFSLDPNARWHDGRPVRASDVRFTYLLHANPKV